MQEVGLGGEWEEERAGEKEEWKKLVWAVMGAREEKGWRGRMAKKVKLEQYVKVKKELKREWFLDETRDWVSRWVNLRAGVVHLEVQEGRCRGVPRRERVCKWCTSGEVEDERHFVAECGAWKERRERLWSRLMEIDERSVWKVRGWSSQRRLEWLLKGGGQNDADGDTEGDGEENSGKGGREEERGEREETREKTKRRGQDKEEEGEEGDKGKERRREGEREGRETTRERESKSRKDRGKREEETGKKGKEERGGREREKEEGRTRWERRYRSI
jgi:hypothetical protein